MNNRRQFLVASTAAVAAAALPKNLFAQRMGGDVFTNASVGAYTQGLLTQERFEQLVGSTFTLFLDDEVAGHLTLMSVAPTAGNSMLSSTSAASPRAQMKRPAPAAVEPTTFHLRFNVSGPKFGQDTYLVDHGTLGRFAMFVVPGEPQQATATFNYLGDPRNWQSVTGPTQAMALQMMAPQGVTEPTLPARVAVKSRQTMTQLQPE